MWCSRLRVMSHVVFWAPARRKLSRVVGLMGHWLGCYAKHNNLWRAAPLTGKLAHRLELFLAASDITVPKNIVAKVFGFHVHPNAEGI